MNPDHATTTPGTMIGSLDDTKGVRERTGAAPRPGPGTLDLTIRRRGPVVELGLAGVLDVTTSSRLDEAMALARDMASAARPRGAQGHCRGRGQATTIVIDTSDVALLDAAGYRALQAAQVAPNGLWDPGVVCILGPAAAKRAS